MNPIAVGPLVWNTLHKLPWVFPNEILSTLEIEFSLSFIYFTLKVFPCKTCSRDGIMLLKSIKFLKLCYVSLNGKKNIVTRYSLGRAVYDFHNMVNAKLGKKKYEKTYEQTLKDDMYEPFNWRKSFMEYLTFLAYYYPSDSDPEWKMLRGEEYNPRYQYNRTLTEFYIKFYFKEIVSKAFVHFKMLDSYSGFESDLIWKDRTNLVRVLMELKKKIHFFEPLVNMRIWDLEELKVFIESCRSKENCDATATKAGNGSLFQGCQ